MTSSKTFYFFFGLLGIGTDSPLATLQVGSFSEDGNIRIQGAAFSSQGWLMQPRSHNLEIGSTSGSVRDLYFGLEGESDINAYFSKDVLVDGNVGIVATYLNYKLCFYIFFYQNSYSSINTLLTLKISIYSIKTDKLRVFISTV